MAKKRCFGSFELFSLYYQLFLKANKKLRHLIRMTLFLFPRSFFRKIFIIFRVIRSERIFPDHSSERIFPDHSMDSRSITADLTVSKDADDYDENKNDDQVFHSRLHTITVIFKS